MMIGFLGASVVVFEDVSTIDPLALVVLGSAFLLGLSNVISRMLTENLALFTHPQLHGCDVDLRWPILRC